MNVAILDDYQNVALRLSDWSGGRRHAEITVFTDHVADPPAVVERLRPFEVVCVMRERTPLTQPERRREPDPARRLEPKQQRSIRSRSPAQQEQSCCSSWPIAARLRRLIRKLTKS